MKVEKTFEARAFLEEACHSEWILRIYRLTLLPVSLRPARGLKCSIATFGFGGLLPYVPTMIASSSGTASQTTLFLLLLAFMVIFFITAIHVTNKLRGLHIRRIGKCIVNFDTVRSTWTRMMFKIILKKRS